MENIIPINQWLWTHMLLTHGKRGPAYSPFPWCPDCQRLGKDWN